MTTAPPRLVVVRVIFAGHITVGGVVSITVTVKLQLPVLPSRSVDWQVTVVVPTGKTPV